MWVIQTKLNELDPQDDIYRTAISQLWPWPVPTTLLFWVCCPWSRNSSCLLARSGMVRNKWWKRLCSPWFLQMGFTCDYIRKSIVTKKGQLSYWCHGLAPEQLLPHSKQSKINIPGFCRNTFHRAVSSQADVFWWLMKPIRFILEFKPITGAVCCFLHSQIIDFTAQPQIEESTHA